MFYLDDSVRVYESDDGGDIDLIVEEFKSFSREDWLSIPREALVLHCSNAHISCTGTKEALANRVHLHFHLLKIVGHWITGETILRLLW